MTNETQEKEWYETYTKKTIHDIEYYMYEGTPQEAEDKIKKFIGLTAWSKAKDINIYTECSSAVMIDVWYYEGHISNNMIMKDYNHFLINRKKNNKGKYGYRIRYII